MRKFFFNLPCLFPPPSPPRFERADGGAKESLVECLTPSSPLSFLLLLLFLVPSLSPLHQTPTLTRTHPPARSPTQANAFAFWDWVGGRYSVCSAVGMLPLALQYSFTECERFLAGAWSMDEHFRDAPLEQNLPVQLGLAGVWNSTFLGYSSCAVLPYCQALAKLAPHIQQVSMESNGKGVTIDGHPLPFKAGEIDFGEPGTNGQHSFYQLIHQGRPVPAEFLGVIKSQQSVYLKGEVVSNHDELMCNFFAQADALAVGKSPLDLRAEGVPDYLIPHKTFTGNRPSLSIVLPALNAYTTGQLLSLYEHRIAVQGFVWGLNSFDQW